MNLLWMRRSAVEGGGSVIRDLWGNRANPCWFHRRGDGGRGVLRSLQPVCLSVPPVTQGLTMQMALIGSSDMERQI